MSTSQHSSYFFTPHSHTGIQTQIRPVRKFWRPRSRTPPRAVRRRNSPHKAWEIIRLVAGAKLARVVSRHLLVPCAVGVLIARRELRSLKEFEDPRKLSNVP